MFTVRLSPLSSFLAAIMVGASLVGSKPVAAQTVAPSPTAPPAADVQSGPTPRQQAWLRASPEQRAILAEDLGEQGAGAFARQRGWQPVLDSVSKSLPQGPDQVWRSTDGVVHVIEAKGGSGQLGNAYGYRQGTPEWAVKSAERMMQSSRATVAERSAGRAILEAAAKGQLEVHVVRTSHVLGEPIAAVLQQSLKSTDETARLARTALDDIARAAANIADDAVHAADGVTRSADDVAQAGETVVAEAGAASKILRTVSPGVIVVAVGVDAGLRIKEGVQIERQYEAGSITVQEREVKHARNSAGMAGGWGGAWAGVELGAWGGGAAGTAVVPGPGTAVGAVAGGVAGGIAGYVGGEAAAEAASEWTVRKVHAAGTTVGDLAHTAWEKTKATGNATADAADRAWHWTSGTAGSAWNATSGGAKRAWHWLAD
jgi:hypothetical protein